MHWSSSLLITLLLGKRPSMANPGGSLRILDLKGLLRASACPFLPTQEGIQPQGGTLLTGWRFCLNQTPCPKSEDDPYTSSTYLELHKLLDGTRGRACFVFTDFFLNNWPHVFYLDPLKMCGTPLFLSDTRASVLLTAK